MISAVWQGAGDKEITQPWGPTTLSVEPWWAAKGCYWHCGVDIGLYKGTPVYAARAGFVATIGYGLLAIRVGTQVDWYVHIDRATVSNFQAVAKGQLVAYSGDKVPAGGVLYGAHLHFEVQSGALNNPASSLDPIPVLRGLFSGGSGGLDDMDPHLLAQLMYLAGLGRVAGRNPDGSAEENWLVDLITKNPSDVGATLGVVVNSTEGKAWAATLAKVRAGTLTGAQGPAGPPGPPGKDGVPGKDGSPPTTGTIAGPIKVTLA